MVAKYFIPAVVALALAGCATTEPTTAVVTVERPKLSLPTVDHLSMRDIEWHVLSKTAKPGQPGSVDEAFRKSNSSSLFALSAKDYEDISVNTANLLKVIKQYQSQIRAYNQYYQQEEQQSKEQGNASKATAR